MYLFVRLRGGNSIFCGNIRRHHELAAQFADIAPEEYLRRRSLPGGGEELLVDNRQQFALRHPGVVLDRAGIDEIMLFYVKGEEK